MLFHFGQEGIGIIFHPILSLQDDKEKKRLDQLDRKKELALMAEQELESMKSAKPKAAEKVTRAKILADQETQRLTAESG